MQWLHVSDVHFVLLHVIVNKIINFYYLAAAIAEKRGGAGLCNIVMKLSYKLFAALPTISI